MNFLRTGVNKAFSKYTRHHIKKTRTQPIECQDHVFKNILKQSQKSLFGSNHLKNVRTISEYQQALKANSYEDYNEYMNKIMLGENNILWPGKPKIITVSSGTTSGRKYIPIYKPLLNSHYSTSLLSGFNYSLETGDFDILDGSLFYLTGLQNFSIKGGVPYGHLGALARNKFPKFLLPGMYPPKNLKHQDNWDDKVQKIIEHIVDHPITLFAGTPPWQVDFLQKFKDVHGKKFGDQFKDFKLFIHSGCSFDPYRQSVFDLIGDTPGYATMENLPASEAFIAFQDTWGSNKKEPRDMLLNLNSNIFFEFIPVENNQLVNDKRLTVRDLEVGQEYALLISVLGGFLSYHLGDNVIVTNLNPVRIKFSGRSRFNVNYIGEHMDYQTILKVFLQLKEDFKIEDFSLLPSYVQGLKKNVQYHWYFTTSDKTLPHQIQQVEQKLRTLCVEANAFYKAIDNSRLLLPPKVHFIQPGSLRGFIKNKSSVGQNKVINVLQKEDQQIEFKQYLKTNDFHLMSSI